MTSTMRKAEWWTWDNERDAMRRASGELTVVTGCKHPWSNELHECVRMGAACYPTHHFTFID